MARIKEIYDTLCSLAPLALQMDFDNSGFQIGRLSAETDTVLLSLDVTDDVVNEAVERGAGLIVSHHPLIFRKLKSISEVDPAQNRILELIRNDIAVISMHTNLDIADGGVNDVLINLLGAQPQRALDASGCGRIGKLDKPVPFDDFIKICSERLNNNCIKYYSSGRPVSKLAVMGGAGGDSLEDAFSCGCDTYVTADLKYHEFLRASELGMNLIDADHFCTENPVMSVLRNKLAAHFPDVHFFVSEKHGQITRYQ